MHRSGTSVVTQWLNGCGLHVGEELVGAETGNEDGHFEDIDFLHAHQSILKGRRITDEGYTEAIPELSNDEKDTLNDIISYKNGFNQQWGWKDPRTCLFLDTYRQLIPTAFYFVVLRDYRSVVSSLIHRIYKRTEKKYSLRTGLSKFIWEHFKKKRRMRMLLKKYSQRYLKVWIAYNEAIARHLQQLTVGNYVVIDFTALSSIDETVFRHLTKEWGFSLNFIRFKNMFRKSRVHEPVNIDIYIKDKTLLDRATTVESSLVRMSFFNTKPQTLFAV